MTYSRDSEQWSSNGGTIQVPDCRAWWLVASNRLLDFGHSIEAVARLEIQLRPLLSFVRDTRISDEVREAATNAFILAQALATLPVEVDAELKEKAFRSIGFDRLGEESSFDHEWNTAFEMFVCSAVANVDGVAVLPLPNKGKRPELICERDGVRLAVECKALSSHNPQTWRQRICDGAEQLSMADVHRRLLMLNVTNIAFDNLIPRESDIDLLNGSLDLERTRQMHGNFRQCVQSHDFVMPSSMGIDLALVYIRVVSGPLRPMTACLLASYPLASGDPDEKGDALVASVYSNISYGGVRFGASVYGQSRQIPTSRLLR